MIRLRILAANILALVAKRRGEVDLDDEIGAHLDLATAHYMTRGMTQAEARTAARRDFGGVIQTKEAYRDSRGLALFDALSQDLRHAVRRLRQAPGFTAVAVLSLALGIGANTALFSILDELVWKSQPVANAGELATLRTDDTREGGHWSYTWFSHGLFQKFRDQTRSLSDVAAIGVIDRFGVATTGPGGGVDPGRATVALVSGNYFGMLGVAAARGRTILPDDDRVPDARAVAVISDAYRRRRFAPGDAAVARTLALNGTTYDIIGVMPPEFTGDWIGRPIDLWIPLMMQAEVMPERPGLRATNFLRIVGRLKGGVTLAQAEADSRPLYRRLREEELGPALNEAQRQSRAAERFGLESAAHGFSPQRDAYATSLAILALAAALVLVIACANVANLVLVRSAARRREMALRVAIGAGAARILRQLVTENVVLAGLGGLGGVLASFWGANVIASLVGTAPTPIDSRSPSQPVALTVHLDARMLVFAIVLVIGTATLFGVLPAVRASRASLASALTARGGGTGGVGQRASRALVVMQVALALPLFIGATLFVRSLHNLRAVDIGVDRDHLLLIWTAPGQTGRPGPQLTALTSTVLQRLSLLPGVRSVSVASNGILTGISDTSGGPSESMHVEGATPKGGLLGISLVVSPRYFQTLGIPLVAGRDFDNRDVAASSHVAIINETMRDALFGDADPIGRHFGYPRDSGTPLQVVGLVKDTTFGSPRDRKRMIAYVPAGQQNGFLGTMCVFVRANGPALSVAARVRQEMGAIDPALPVLSIDTVDGLVDTVLAQDRLLTALATAAGVLTVLLACIGLYGVVAYTTARRTSEIGIRMALGATRHRVLALVFRESLVLVSVGIVIGVPAALAATRLAGTQFFGVKANDPMAFVAATGLMIAVTGLAGFLPARRAANVDPLVALRCE